MTSKHHLQINPPWYSIIIERKCSVQGSSKKVLITPKCVLTRSGRITNAYSRQTNEYIDGIVIPDKFLTTHDTQIKLPFDVNTNIASHK